MIFIAAARKLVIKPASASLADLAEAITIKPTKEQSKDENEANNNEMQFFMEAVRKSGFMVPEKIPEFIKIIQTARVPFGRINTLEPFSEGDCLSAQEKKNLSLNARYKYTKRLIEFFDPLCLKNIEPKSVLISMHIDSFHRASRKKDLQKFERIGFVKKVKICTSEQCAGVKPKQPRTGYGLNEVPELPFPGCDRICMCYYTPVID